MRHTNAMFGGFEVGFQLSANSSVSLLYTRDNGALTWQPNLGLKLLFLSTTDNDSALCNYRGFCGWPINVATANATHQCNVCWFWDRVSDTVSVADISDGRGLMHIPMATKFWPNRPKLQKIRDTVPLLHSTLSPCKLMNSNSILAYERHTVKLM